MHVNPDSLYYREHVARYEFARNYINDGPILDIASGTGYGSELLHSSCRAMVVGVDVDWPSIEGCTPYICQSAHHVLGCKWNAPAISGYFLCCHCESGNDRTYSGRQNVFVRITAGAATRWYLCHLYPKPIVLTSP